MQEEIMDRVQEREVDPQDFAHFYRKEVDTVYKFITIRLTDPARTEDVVSRVFLALLMEARSGQPPLDWKERTLSITREHLRKLQGDGPEEQAASIRVDDEIGPEVRNLVDNQLLRLLSNQLSPREAEAIYLRAFVGLSLDQGARIMGCEHDELLSHYRSGEASLMRMGALRI